MHRRTYRLLGLLIALTILMAACTAPAAPAADSGSDAGSDDAAAATDQERPQMTFWMNFNFEESVNELIRQQVQEWADENNVDIEILIAEDTDLSAKWSAGLEAPDTLPDVSVVFAQWFPVSMTLACSWMSATPMHNLTPSPVASSLPQAKA